MGARLAANSFAISVFLFWICLWKLRGWQLTDASTRLELHGPRFSAERFFLHECFGIAPLPSLVREFIRKRAREPPSIETRLAVFNRQKVRKIEMSAEKWGHG